MYILSTGRQRWANPKDLPARSTLDDCLDLRRYDGTLDRLHESLSLKCFEQVARAASPTAMIIDSQSVKSSENAALGSIRMSIMRA